MKLCPAAIEKHTVLVAHQRQGQCSAVVCKYVTTALIDVVSSCNRRVIVHASVNGASARLAFGCRPSGVAGSVNRFSAICGESSKDLVSLEALPLNSRFVVQK